MSAIAIAPLWFGRPEAPVAGWLHAPDAPGRDLSVVVCGPPFGWEDVCAYRSLRTLATTLAAAGLPTLRFDFPGTGDSADAESESGRWGDWVAAVGDAVAVVGEHGPERCALIGIGLGGAVAMTAIDEGLSVDGIVLWDAVVTGRAWLRQARAFQRLAARAHVSTPALAADSDEELAGFPLASPLRADLEVLDLRVLPAAIPAAWSRAFVIASVARGDRSATVTALTDRGAPVEQAVFGGIETMLDEPHRASPATEGFHAIRDLLVAHSATSTRPAPEPVASGPAVPSAGVCERVLVVQHRDAPDLCAVESRPVAGSASDRWFVFLNAAGVRHIGPNRMWVRFARTLAAQGICSLRVDVRGVGDGGGEEFAGNTIGAYYDSILWDDVGRLADHARSLGATRLVLVGLCSGATAAFQVACRRDDVRGLVMLNPLLLDWDERAAGASEADTTWRSAIRSGYWLRGSRWRKLVRGQVPMRALGRAVGARVTLRRGAASLGPVEQLRALAGSGVDVHLLAAKDDASADFITRLAGGDTATLAVPGLDVRVLAGPDHTFRPMTSQEELYRIIEGVAERVA
jgi:pimeloyl-ACP methyl ester carboxylesterase